MDAKLIARRRRRIRGYFRRLWNAVFNIRGPGRVEVIFREPREVMPLNFLEEVAHARIRCDVSTKNGEAICYVFWPRFAPDHAKLFALFVKYNLVDHVEG